MNFRLKMFKQRALMVASSVALFLATSPLTLAAEDEEESASDPVWVLSYATFILFAAATIMIAIFFSKRRETMLDVEDQKKVSQIKTQRIVKRRKEEQLAKMHAQKKH